MFLRETSCILHNVAVVDEYDNRLTYKDLEDMSKYYSAIIQERCVIMILCDYFMDTVSLYYCMMNNHIVPILLDSSIDSELLNNLIHRYKPQYIWMRKENSDYTTLYNTVLELDKHILLRTNYDFYEIYSKLALLISTSGSTGSPKFVRLSYDNLKHNAMISSKMLKISETDRGITTLPMQFCYGLSLLHIHWFVGATTYITTQNLLSVNFWQFYYKYKITNFHGVPYTYEILKRVGFSKRKHPYLKFVTQGGGKMNEKECDYWRGYFKGNTTFYRLYGLTEGTTILCGLELRDDYKNISGNIGKALEDISVKIKTLENESYGELLFSGPSICLGYAYNFRELVKKDENQGQLNSGDLAVVDEDGYIYIKGRKKRFVKMLGKSISLDELEQILTSYYKTNEIVCIGKDDDLGICLTDLKIDENDIKMYCYKKIGINKRMIKVYYLKELPRNKAGKILYSNLEMLN